MEPARPSLVRGVVRLHHGDLDQPPAGGVHHGAPPSQPRRDYGLNVKRSPTRFSETSHRSSAFSGSYGAGTGTARSASAGAVAPPTPRAPSPPSRAPAPALRPRS